MHHPEDASPDDPVNATCPFPTSMPEIGMDETTVFKLFAKLISDRSTQLGAPTAFAHMDPPTPPLAAQLVGLNATHNQNLLHPDLSPFATIAERCVIDWLAPAFGMSDGHLCGGSTLANLTALWCAREHGALSVAASKDAHLSIPKAAHLLGMAYNAIPVDGHGRAIVPAEGFADDCAVVLTAGTTGRGVIDPLKRPDCAWLHVDAAWAGPLQLTRHAVLLDGIKCADSIAVSAHKWLYQPKDSALVLFRSPDVQSKISFGGSYLSVPNVGVQGSRGAAGVPLLATLMAWGREGLAARIEKNVDDCTRLANVLEEDDRVLLKQRPDTAVINWRPMDSDMDTDDLLVRLGTTSSRTTIDGKTWVRQVAANPYADIDAILEVIDKALKN